MAVALAAFGGVNVLWNLEALHLYEYVPHAIPAYLVAGSGLALVLIWRAVSQGLLTRRDLGLELAGWTAPKRLAGLALILFMGYGGYATLNPQTEMRAVPASSTAEGSAPVNPAVGDSGGAAPKPTWSDYSFWFVFLLAPTVAELLVFISVTFCLTERWLRVRLGRPIPATLVAAVFASVVFGLYHYTYEPRWHQYALQLIFVMLINLAYFIATRNFYLTLVLHNAFAAVGFTGEQYREYPPDLLINPATFQNAAKLAPILIAFTLPFLALHWMEWKGWPGPEKADGSR